MIIIHLKERLFFNIIKTMNKGLLVIISGPSGVGKGTLRKKLLETNDLNLFYSVSMTTRKPRVGEVNGSDYYFVSKEEFDKNIESGNLLEWAEFVGNKYGTPKDKVEEQLSQGKNVLLEIEVNGTDQVLSKVDDVCSIFIMPPSLEELENRIRGRSTETEDVIQSRLEKARKEFLLKEKYKHIVINDDLDKAVNEIRKIIEGELK